MSLQFNPFTGTFDVTTKGDTGAVAAAGDGSAAAPGITFASDTNTGIYRPGEDQLALSTGGTGRLIVDSLGLVSIGDSGQLVIGKGESAIPANSVKAHIFWGLDSIYGGTSGDLIMMPRSSAAANLRIYTGSTTPSERFRITGTGQLSHIGAGSAVSPAVSFNGGAPSNSFVITSAGRVGIGTTSPGALFHSSASNNGPTTVGLFENTSTGAAAYTNIQLKAGTNTALIGLGSSGTATGNLYIGNDQNKDLDLYTGSANIKFQIASTERLRIDSSGRLLVGTSSTSAGSTFVLQGNTASSGIGIISLANTGSSPVNGEALGVIRFTSNTHNAAAAILAARDAGTWTSGSSEPTRLTFFTTSDASASPTERLRITSAGVLQVADAGNIAVGTTTGTKIGTATTQKLGFFNKTPVVQPAAVADATDAASVITQLNALLARMRDLGLIAT